MTTIAQSVNSIAITNSTVNSAVGICYFDAQSESLLELSQLPNHHIMVDPLRQVIRKYYIVVSPGEVLSYVKASVSRRYRRFIFSKDDNW